jgi:hypothetical protein
MSTQLQSHYVPSLTNTSLENPFSGTAATEAFQNVELVFTVIIPIRPHNVRFSHS